MPEQPPEPPQLTEIEILVPWPFGFLLTGKHEHYWRNCLKFRIEMNRRHQTCMTLYDLMVAPWSFFSRVFRYVWAIAPLNLEKAGSKAFSSMSGALCIVANYHTSDTSGRFGIKVS